MNLVSLKYKKEGSRHLVVVSEVFGLVDRNGLFLSIDEDLDGGSRRVGISARRSSRRQRGASWSRNEGDDAAGESGGDSAQVTLGERLRVDCEARCSTSTAMGGSELVGEAIR